MPAGAHCALRCCHCPPPTRARSIRPSPRPALFLGAMAPRSAEGGSQVSTVDPDSDTIAALAAFDTPTICNALEVVLPATRARGYTTRPAHCGFPAMRPIVGYARTARIRARAAPTLPAGKLLELRHGYYRYIDAGRKPSLVLIEDLDGP